jgi:hypothetical protein
MGISPPIQGQDLETLPDDTAFVADLADKDAIERVFPYFLGDGDTGRFVTSFVAFTSNDATLYARRRTNDTVDFEQITTATVDDPVDSTGSLWNQAAVFAGDDLDTVVELRERAAYETTWLFAGDDPRVDFERYQFDPTTHEPTGFEDCDHVPDGDSVRVPNLGIPVSTCTDCDTPLFLPESGNGKQTMEVLNALNLDESFGDRVIRGFRVDPTGDVTGLEEATHVLSRMANNENPSLPHYARGGMNALVFLVGDQIVGYAGWQTFDDVVVLRSLYLLPEFRGDGGLGETLVEGFFDELLVDEYYVETPNQAARDALARAGHLDTGIATPVATLACRDTTDASEPNAIYADPRPRAYNPVF